MGECDREDDDATGLTVIGVFLVDLWSCLLEAVVVVGFCKAPVVGCGGRLL